MLQSRQCSILTFATHPTADADRLVSAADLAQFGKIIVAVAKKYFTLPGGGGCHATHALRALVASC